MRSGRLIPLICITAAVALGACSSSSGDPLLDHLAAVESSVDDPPVVESLSFGDLFGPQWREFALICPYTPRAEVEGQLGVKDPPIPEHGLSDGDNAVLLKEDDGGEQWIQLSRAEVDLCSGSIDPGLRPSSESLDFVLKHRAGVWELADGTAP